MTANAIMFILVILGVITGGAVFLTQGVKTLALGFVSETCWLIATILIAPDSPFMIILFLVIMVVVALYTIQNILKGEKK